MGEGRSAVDARGALAAGWFASAARSGRRGAARSAVRPRAGPATSGSWMSRSTPSTRSGSPSSVDGDVEAVDRDLDGGGGALARGEGVPVHAARLLPVESRDGRVRRRGTGAGGRARRLRLTGSPWKAAIPRCWHTRSCIWRPSSPVSEQLQPGCEALRAEHRGVPKPRVPAWHRLLPDRRRRARSRRRGQSFGRRAARLGTRPVREHRDSIKARSSGRSGLASRRVAGPLSAGRHSRLRSLSGTRGRSARVDRRCPRRLRAGVERARHRCARPRLGRDARIY